MNTIFKEGQKVYDQVNYPDCEGKVIKVYDDSILVMFEGVENYYSLDGRAGDAMPTLSTRPYKVNLEGFEQKSIVPTFEDAVKWLRENNKYTVSIGDDSRATFFTKDEDYSAFDALRKLTIIRDYYNEGWKPDWKNDEENKYVILTENDKIKCEENYSYKRVLSFKSNEIRNKFLEEQIDLLEIAKPLL